MNDHELKMQKARLSAAPQSDTWPVYPGDRVLIALDGEPLEGDVAGTMLEGAVMHSLYDAIVQTERGRFCVSPRQIVRVLSRGAEYHQWHSND